MAGFYQWETVDLLITLDKAGALVDTSDVVVSVVQGQARVDYHKADLAIDEDAGTIGVHFTQEDAGKFSNTKAQVQVNILYASGERDVTAQGTISVFQNLYKQVM